MQRMQRLGRSPQQAASKARLHTEQVERVLAGCGQIGTAKRVAAALGCKIIVHGWRMPHKARTIDLASSARLCEKTTTQALVALNSLASCSPSVLVETLEALLFTCDGAEFVLKENSISG